MRVRHPNYLAVSVLSIFLLAAGTAGLCATGRAIILTGGSHSQIVLTVVFAGLILLGCGLPQRQPRCPKCRTPIPGNSFLYLRGKPETCPRCDARLDWSGMRKQSRRKSAKDQ